MEKDQNNKSYVNIRDVSDATGMSICTVSKALNDAPGVNKKTRAMIKKKAEEMGYIPNLIGKAINKKRSEILGVILPVSTFGLTSFIESGIIREAEVHNLSVFVSYSHDNSMTESKVLTIMSQMHVRGIIMAPVPYFPNTDRIRAISEDIPLIQVERYIPDTNTDYIGSDNFGTAYKATKKCLEKGHCSIGFVTDKHMFSTEKERLEGYKKALKEADIEFKEEWLLHTGESTTTKSTLRQLEGYLHNPKRPKAILWSAFFLGYAAEIIEDMGCKNGKDFDIHAFDVDLTDVFYNQEFPNYMQDGITMGRLAVQRFLKVENNMTDGAPLPPVNEKIPYVHTVNNDLSALVYK